MDGDDDGDDDECVELLGGTNRPTSAVPPRLDAATPLGYYPSVKVLSK